MSASARRVMAALGGVQGLALWLIVEHSPDDPHRAAFFFAASTFLLVSALVLHFARTGEHRNRLIALAAATAGVFALISLWVAWQLPAAAAPHQGDRARITSFVFASLVALYALGPFVQIFQRTGRGVFPYPDLYRHAWNNFFVAALGGLYLIAVWVVLLLWGQLFALVGVDSFKDLFQKEPFIYGVTGAALAYGLAAGHESDRVIATLRSLAQAMFRAIEPILAAVTLGFLATLPFTGLAPLFAATSAASIVMSWIAAHVVFLNAVYLDGSEPPPYDPLVRRLVEAGTVAAPVLAAIGIYAVVLRIEQHGLTPDRVFALVISSVLGLYALGYAVAAVLRGEPWLPRLRAVNVGLAWVVIALALSLHTPLLDPLGLSLRSQLDRLVHERVSPENFDFGFLRFELGHAGYAALTGLAHEKPFAEYAARALAIEDYWRWRDRPQSDPGPQPVFTHLPAAMPLPEPLVRGLEGSLGRLVLCEASQPCVVVPVELDGEGESEYLLAQARHPQNNYVLARDTTQRSWIAVGRLEVQPELNDSDAWIKAIADGRARAVAPRYGDVEVDGRRLRFSAVPTP